MKAPAFIRIITALALVLGLTGCRDKHDWHQRLTVRVETPQGVRSGASVVEVTAWFGRIPLSGNEVEYRVQGEATVVEIAPGKYLFALLPGSAERFYWSARDRFKGMSRGEWLGQITRQSAPVELSDRAMPRLVIFGDINDPTSVQRVDPVDLAASFGPGVRLKSITLEITDAPVSTGKVEAVLGWFNDKAKLDAIWPELSSDQHTLLSSYYWVRG